MPSAGPVSAITACALLIVGCSKEPNDGTRDASPRSAQGEKNPIQDASSAAIDLDALLPKGTGWKCVYERCARTCIYPRSARVDTDHGPPSLPPCVDRETATCVGMGMSPGNAPAAYCFTTMEACERERAAATFGATKCSERR